MIGPSTVVAVAVFVPLVGAATVQGVWLAARGRRSPIWLGAGAGGLLVIGLRHLVPDACDGARAAGLPGWLIGLVVTGTFATAAGVSRIGCTCRADATRRSGTTTAAALVIHRALEGTVIAVAGPVVAAGLAVHALSEGMAVGALLSPDISGSRRRLVVWSTLLCVAPVFGVVAAGVIPRLNAEPLLLAAAAGILLEAARTSLSMAIGHRMVGAGPSASAPIVAATVSALVTLIAVRVV